MSVSTRFDNFCFSLKIPSNLVDDISYRYKRITRRLNIDFRNTDSDTANSLYVGSYGRDTDIHTSDVDMLYILPNSVYERIDRHLGNGQSALLQEIRNSIQNTYNSYISADGQVVKVDFTDNITFEILPCFVNKDGCYTYPDTNGGGKWKITNPRPEIDAIKTGNISWNNNLKNLCRIARSWKDNWNVPIGGLLIDTLAYNFLKDWEYRNNSYTYYDWMVRDFFSYLKNQDENKQYWLAVGSGQYIFRTGKFEYKALRCYNIAKEAVDYESRNMEWSAGQKWQEIFGNRIK